jgi:DoxX-like protein
MTLVDSIACTLAAAFIWAGALNLSGPDFVQLEFERWGYSRGLRVAVGLTEWSAAALLLASAYRLAGALLGLAVLIGVVISLGRTREWMRIEYPVVLIMLSFVVAAASWPGGPIVFADGIGR